MPVNSGPASCPALRANQLAKRGSRALTIAGVTRIEIRTDDGGSGPSAVATVGKRESGGPTFSSKWARPTPYQGRFTITGTTYDSGGAPLASCTVFLWDRSANIIRDSTVSDGSGVFTFTVGDNSTERWAVATNTGVAGATIGPLTLVPSP